MPLPLSVIVLTISFILVAVRQIGRIKLQIWQIILGGALIVLLTGQISVSAAASYIDPTVIVFLIGIFILGEAMVRSGYIQYLAHRLFKRFGSVDHLVLAIIFSMGPLAHTSISIKDKGLAKLCKISIALLGISILTYTVLGTLGMSNGLSFAYIAIIAALPILLFSKERVQIIKGIDWSTIVLFIALFVLVGSVWQSGFFQNTINGLHLGISQVPTILIVNILGSQLISNVPMTLLYLKLLSYTHVTTAAAMALVAGSTIAGNLFILGAASNVIIIQMAEKKYKSSLSFLDFAKVGIVVTVLNAIVYWIFLTI